MSQEEEEKEIDYWMNIRQESPEQPHTPVVVANYRRQMLPFMAYLDQEGQWRNYHTKFPVPEVEWWLKYFPAFPKHDVPEANRAEEIERLRKIIRDQDASMASLLKAHGKG
jgi:hypothetical protein